MKTKRCPNCEASTIAAGHFARYSGEPLSRLRFEPAGMRVFSFRWLRGVPINQGAQCCMSCGHTWTTLDAQELRSYIKQYGNQAAVEALEPFEKGKSEEELA